MISWDLLRAILPVYGFTEEIIDTSILQESSEINGILYLYKICLKNGTRLVCRISDDRKTTVSRTEAQCRFSELMRRNGICTPRIYEISDHFTMHLTIDGIDCIILLEDYAGEDIDDTSFALYGYLGELLGKMHAVSEANPMKIPNTKLYEAILNGNASFERILEKADPVFRQLPATAEITKLHDGLVYEVQGLLEKLPLGTVHGDLSVFNNLVKLEGNISVIDYALAGREPFLSDLLSAFYASIYRYRWKDPFDSIQLTDARLQYMRSYYTQRKLHGIEISSYPLIAALFDGLFYCKSIIYNYQLIHDDALLDDFIFATQHFNPSKHHVDFIGG